MVQLALYGRVQALLLSRMVWFIRTANAGQVLAETVTRFREGVAAMEMQDSLDPGAVDAGDCETIAA